jgi:hypothetical protein
MKKIFAIAIVMILITQTGIAQNHNVVKKPEMLRQMHRQEIRIPNIPGYETLKCDFHIHTIFSDGDVWPTVRVQEAYYEGLDAIALTDHIENQPGKKFVGGDQNSSYEIALPEAEKRNILLVKAGEITRGMPPGHLNALFVDDVTKLDVPDYMDAIEEANNQGAFVFWNHPGWQAQQPDTNKWWDVHEEIYQNGWLHGIEVFNWDEYYPVAFEWCNEKNLAYLGNSDVHMASAYRFDLENYRRPMTLVFAKDRSLEALKEALFARRTAAFFADEIAGPEALLTQLFNASVTVHQPFNVEDETAHFEISNPTDLTFILENETPASGAPAKIEIAPRSSAIAQCNLKNGKAVLPYAVTNLYTGKTSNLMVELEVTK